MSYRRHAVFGGIIGGAGGAIIGSTMPTTGYGTVIGAIIGGAIAAKVFQHGDYLTTANCNAHTERSEIT